MQSPPNVRGRSSRADARRSLGAPAAPPVAGRYALLERLGAGGMGAVYRARDEQTGRTVAFKQLLTTLTGSRRRMVEMMFEREYHTLVRLKHPRVIEVYDYGLTEQGPYYTMELLEGQDLQQLAPLPYASACAHLRDVASLLGLLSAHRLVHRDVSPRNVRFGADGRAKLIDFGALHPFGPAMDIVGTPPCMAPEVLSKTLLDQRTDLYALGAVGYFALTGRHAYPARKLEELPALWRARPPPPSQFAPGVPPALDDLILALLRTEPVARPSHPAAVIDELCAIGDLPAEAVEVAAQSYLLSGRMVGRKAEQDAIGAWIARAVEGRGGEVILDGRAGVGKTRLLQETALDAQLRGLSVLRGDGRELARPFGVANALGLQLLTASADQALSAAGPHAGVLGHLSPELHEKLGSPALDPLPAAPAERRARLQAALHDWFVAVAKQQPLLLAVDNLQAVDDNSAAFLATFGALARKHKVLVLAAQQTGEDVMSPAPVRDLRTRAAQLALGNLDLEASAELVRSLFGHVPNADRLARRLHERCAGNPQQLMELAEFIVDKKVVTYVGGTWVLPLEVEDEELPRGAEGLSEARLSGLSAHARLLLDAVSVHDRPVTLELATELSTRLGSREASDIHAALDELVASQLLVFEQARYRFAREALREALLERMTPEARRDRNRQLAECLLARPRDDLAAHFLGARHLLAAGDDTRGAELLAQLAPQLLPSQSLELSPDEIARGLHAALRIFKMQKRTPRDLIGLMAPMLEIAYYSHEWRLLLDYGEELVSLGADVFGLRRADRLRPWLGPKLALLASFLIARLSFARHSTRSRRGLSFMQAFQLFLGTLPAVSGTIVLVFDAPALVRMTGALRALCYLGPTSPLAFSFHFMRRLADVARGRMSSSFREFDAAVQGLHSPELSHVFSAERRANVYGGMLCGRAINASYRFGDTALEAAGRAEALGIRTWQVGAAQGRMLHHALRGEADAVQRYRSIVERAALQGGTTWQIELVLPVSFITVNFLYGDTIGVRQLAEQLARRARSVPPLQPYADLARAIYLSLRGQLPEALTLFDQIAQSFKPLERTAWPARYCAHAQALIRSGQHARAKALLEEALAQTSEAEAEFVGFHLEIKRQLALAEAGLEHRGEAIAMLDALLAKHGRESNPLLVGLLHKARAEVALGGDEVDAFKHHFAEFESRFRATGTPALVAQCDRLAAKARKLGVRLDTIASVQPSASDTGTYFSVIEADAAGDPFAHVLHALVHHSHARCGYLYVFEHGSMRLVAATSADEAPVGLETQLRVTAEATEEEAAAPDAPGAQGPSGEETDAERAASCAISHVSARSSDATALVDTPPSDATEIVAASDTESMPLDRYCVRTLIAKEHGAPRIVGGVILEPDPARALAVAQPLLDAVAEFLQRRGSVPSGLT